ncbi:MAG: ornithine cyclodeaminase family protein [Acidobacteria bacterium]|nr:MAG: ornithine cyclodeaminase family protein [Acidobacteriota bacterium]
MQIWLDAERVRARLRDSDGLRAAMAAALMDLYCGRASAPARIAAHAPTGLLAAMPGAASGMLGAKLVSVFPRNPERGLPGHQALIALFDADTGTPVAILEATALTAARTGAVSAVATDALAREDARVLAILGTGVQAQAHWEAVRRVRPFTEIRVAGRTAAHVQARAAEWEARPMKSFAAAVRGADVVCACTHADEPVVRREWIQAGAHINSVGIGGGEIDRATVEAGLLAVESRGAFAPFPAGAYELQGMDPASGIELGAILAGEHAGRTDAAQITVFKSVGHAVEDVAAAAWLVEQSAC